VVRKPKRHRGENERKNAVCSSRGESRRVANILQCAGNEQTVEADFRELIDEEHRAYGQRAVRRNSSRQHRKNVVAKHHDGERDAQRDPGVCPRVEILAAARVRPQQKKQRDEEDATAEL
jgi:hypothetical protein